MPIRNNTFAAPLELPEEQPPSSTSLPPLARRSSSGSSLPLSRRGSMCSVASSVASGSGTSGFCQHQEDVDGNRKLLRMVKKMSKDQRRSFSESLIISPVGQAQGSFRHSNKPKRRDSSSRSGSCGDSVSSGVDGDGGGGSRRRRRHRSSSRSRSGSISCSSNYGYVDPGIPKSICLS